MSNSDGSGCARQMIKDKRLNARLEVDSAGTANFHLSESPDTRAIKADLARGYNLSRQRARQFNASDYEHFDLILAMDKSNLSDQHERYPPHFRQKLGLFLNRSMVWRKYRIPIGADLWDLRWFWIWRKKSVERLSMSLSTESSKGVFRNYVDS